MTTGNEGGGHVKSSGFVRRLLSPTVLDCFEPCDNPEALAAIWPMNGDREWASRCVEWLNRHLARRPTPKESLHLVFRVGINAHC